MSNSPPSIREQVVPQAQPAQRKTNVLIAIAGLGIGGAEVVVQRLAQSIDRERFNLTVCCLKVRGLIGDDMARDGIEIVVLNDGNSDGKVDYLTFLKLLKLIRERNIDVVHTHTTDSLVEAALCKLMRPRVKLIHTFHFGNYPHRVPRELWMERVFSRVATLLVAVGEVQKQQLRNVFGYGDKAVRRIWNGVAFSNGRGGEAFRRSLGAENKVLIGTLATLTKQKGLFDFLEVAQRFQGLRDKVHFVIVGEGSLRAPLEAKRDELDLQDIVSISGWITNAAAVALPAFDVFYQPSHWEAMSIALLEGMAAGKAIVATRVGEAPHIIEEGVDGLLVDARDIDGQVATLRRLVDDPQLRERLGSAAAKKARRQFSIEHMARAYEEVYAGAR